MTVRADDLDRRFYITEFKVEHLGSEDNHRSPGAMAPRGDVDLAIRGHRVGQFFLHCPDCVFLEGIIDNGVCLHCDREFVFDWPVLLTTDEFVLVRLRNALVRAVPNAPDDLIDYGITRAQDIANSVFRANLRMRAEPQPIMFTPPAQLRPHDEAAQTTGMLFADQDSTGMLF